MTLAHALTERLAKLPPPRRQPAPGGTAHELVQVFGKQEETFALEAMRAVFFWLAATTDESGLELLGHSRYLHRLPNEPIETYRKRVMGAFQFWEMAGTVPGVELALAQAGYRATVIEHQTYDPDSVRWAEFSVIVGPAEPLKASAHWSQGDQWDGQKYWGFQLPAVPLDYLVELIREVKPAHARLRRLIWSPRGRYWGGGMNWGDGHEDATPPLQTFWGVQTGLQGYVPPPERTDSGPAWGESDNEIIYEYQGAPNA